MHYRAAATTADTVFYREVNQRPHVRILFERSPRGPFPYVPISRRLDFPTGTEAAITHADPIKAKLIAFSAQLM